MKIRYMDQEGPEHTSTQGYDFTRGEWVEVTDPFAIAKLSGNRYFEVKRDAEVKFSAPSVPKKRGRPRLN